MILFLQINTLEMFGNLRHFYDYLHYNVTVESIVIYGTMIHSLTTPPNSSYLRVTFGLPGVKSHYLKKVILPEVRNWFGKKHFRLLGEVPESVHGVSIDVSSELITNLFSTQPIIEVVKLCGAPIWNALISTFTYEDILKMGSGGDDDAY